MSISRLPCFFGALVFSAGVLAIVFSLWLDNSEDGGSSEIVAEHCSDEDVAMDLVSRFSVFLFFCFFRSSL